MEVAKRLHSVEEYYFSKKLKQVNALKASGKPIINLGIGSPDLQPSEAVVNAIKASLVDANAHKYQSYQGLPELREAIASFYSKHYQVALNPTSEILPLMGSKEGIMHISMAFLNKGDKVLIPNPGYPTYSSVTKLLEAEPVYYNLDEAHDWCPNFEALEAQDLSQVKLMWVNYPHMPTGAKASKTVFEEIIKFAKKHDILVINDNPYSFVLNETPQSILSVEGAEGQCLELNSLSKTFNMAGWRVGMLLGAKKHIDAVLKVKSNMDSGMFYGIQKGAIEALKSTTQWFDAMNAIYQKRRELVWKLATALHCEFDREAVGMFVWAKLPEAVQAEPFIDDLLLEKNIFITPGTIFGSQGKGYVRFSLCAEEAAIQDAIDRVS